MRSHPPEGASMHPGMSIPVDLPPTLCLRETPQQDTLKAYEYLSSHRL